MRRPIHNQIPAKFWWALSECVVQYLNNHYFHVFISYEETRAEPKENEVNRLRIIYDEIDVFRINEWSYEVSL
jgi:hypothetical protein